MDKYNFQYCQKLVVYSKDEQSVLLCKRKGEADYDGDYSFIGGKMENTDESIVMGVKREKDEEVGGNFKIKVFPAFVTNVMFTKKDGNVMILPHFYCIHVDGEITLNEEYSDFKWVPLDKIGSFEPKIDTIPGILANLIVLKKIIHRTNAVIV